MTSKIKILTLITFLICALQTACDPERRKECEWFFAPNPDTSKMTDKNMVAVCAKNLISNKQDCRLQTDLEFAKKASKLRFRYSQLKVMDFGNPRTIDKKNTKFCRPQKKD